MMTERNHSDPISLNGRISNIQGKPAHEPDAHLGRWLDSIKQYLEGSALN